MRKYLIIAISLLLFSCSKENKSTTGNVTLQITNKVGSQNLTLNTVWYRNANNDSFTVTTLKYFLSNFVFTKEDGTVITIPKDDSYFLVDASSASSQQLSFKNLPSGNYKTLSFIIGVDSLKSTAPLTERTGVLDPSGTALGMYWAWNSGYIFLKLEGKSPQSIMPDSSVYYHIGLFGGYSSPTLNNIRVVTLNINDNKLTIDGDNTTVLNLQADVLKIYNGDSWDIQIGTNSEIMVNPLSANVANNYRNMFSIQ